ncbi:hypothetical protein D3C84_910780 [compost metagenome]
MAEQLEQRDLHAFLTCHGVGEHRRFMQFEAHVQANHHQHSAEQKGNAPAPRAELFIVEQHRQCQEQAIRRQKADGGAELREHAEPRTLAFGGVLGGQ